MAAGPAAMMVGVRVGVNAGTVGWIWVDLNAGGFDFVLLWRLRRWLYRLGLGGFDAGLG